MLRVATKYVAACAVTVTLPNELRYNALWRNFGFYCFLSDASSDDVRDLGSPPKTGELDSLGNRPVIHSNVRGQVTKRTRLRITNGKPNEIECSLSIPWIDSPFERTLASAYYLAQTPWLVNGSKTVTPAKFDSRFAHCRITCSISGSPSAITVTVKVDVGVFTNDVTGKKEPVSGGYASVVLTPGHDYSNGYYHCGRVSNKNSEMGVTVRSAFPVVPGQFHPSYAEGLLVAFKPAVWQIQTVHSLLATRQITIGDSKAISDAFESVRLASFNGLAFTRDTRKLVRDTSRLIRDIRAVRRDPSRIASIWLSYRYGHRLYYKDCRDLLRAASNIKRAKPLKFRGRHTEYLHLLPGSTTRVEYNFTLYCSPFCFTDLGLEQQLRLLGFWPSAENLWDLVPYSFVADWFIDITDICKRYDMRQDILRYPILGAVQSVKCTTQTSAHNASGTGTAEVTYYMRLPLTPARLSTTLLNMNLSLMSGISLMHAADALALAVARRGH